MFTNLSPVSIAVLLSVIKNDDVVAAAFEHRLENVEVYRAHLRAEDCIALFFHFARNSPRGGTQRF